MDFILRIDKKLHTPEVHQTSFAGYETILAFVQLMLCLLYEYEKGMKHFESKPGKKNLDQQQLKAGEHAWEKITHQMTKWYQDNLTESYLTDDCRKRTSKMDLKVHLNKTHQYIYKDMCKDIVYE